MKLYMFQTVPHSIIRSFSLYTQQWYMSYRFADSCEQDQVGTSWSCLKAVRKPVWHIPLLCVRWKTPDDGQRNCPKNVEIHSKNKFEKLVHLVGFIIRKVPTLEDLCTSKTSVIIYHLIHHNAKEKLSLHQHLCENLKCYKFEYSFSG